MRRRQHSALLQHEFTAMSEWLHGHRRSLLLAFALLVLAGLYAAWRLPVALFPQIDFPRVLVSIEAGDRPVDRMVLEVTQPLETALRAIPKVRTIRSTSSRGAAEISLGFDWGTDMVVAALQTQAAVNAERTALPEGAEFEVRRMDPTVFPTLGLSLSSASLSDVEITEIARFQLSPALSTIEGVAKIEILGGRQAELEVLLDPRKLAAAGLSTTELASVLAADNTVSAVGRLEDRFRLFLVLNEARVKNAKALGETVLKVGSSGVLMLKDVAEIRLDVAPAWTAVNADGRAAVLVNVMQQPGANSVALSRAVAAKLAALKSTLPASLKVASYYDQSDLTLAAALSVQEAILIGALLAAMVLFVFLRQWRITLLVAFALPAVIAVTALALSYFGMSLNIMTLGGIAAAVGLVVDDAVVMLEHGMRRMCAEAPADGAISRISGVDIGILAAAVEMFKPLSGSSLATVVVFLPLSFLGGVAGGFFKALALTMACALSFSYLVALLIVPLLMQQFVSREHALRAEKSAKWFVNLQKRFAKIASALLGRPALAGMILLIPFGLGAWAYLNLPSGFMPHMDEGGFILDYVAAPGTSLAQTDRLVRQMEEIILKLPELGSYSRRTGLQLGGGLTESNAGDLFVRLKSNRDRDIDEVMRDLRVQVAEKVPGLEIETAQLMEDLIGDLIANPQPVEIKVLGSDAATRAQNAQLIAKTLGKIEGIVEIKDGARISGDAVQIDIDRLSASRFGLNAASIGTQLQSLIEGSVVSQLQEKNQLIAVKLWTPVELRARVEQLSQLTLSGAAQNPDGSSHELLLPLGSVAKISVISGQPQIDRDNLRDTVIVTARLEDRDLGSAMAEVQRKVKKLKLSHGISVEYGGLYLEQQQSFRELTVVFISAVLLIALVLMFLFESIAVVLSSLTVTLAASASVFVGLWLTGSELNLSSLMGLTMVVGVITEIAVFYFSEISDLKTASEAALIAAGTHRLRPILMTSSIAILTLLPLGLGLGAGAAMQQPLAIAIISGLIAGVPLVLLVLPAVYSGLRRAI